MNTTDPQTLTAEMAGTVDAFFRDVTPAEFSDFMSEIGEAHYRTITESVLPQQPGSETFTWQFVTFDFETPPPAFRELVEEVAGDHAAADHEDLALAA